MISPPHNLSTNGNGPNPQKLRNLNALPQGSGGNHHCRSRTVTNPATMKSAPPALIRLIAARAVEPEVLTSSTNTAIPASSRSATGSSVLKRVARIRRASPLRARWLPTIESFGAEISINCLAWSTFATDPARSRAWSKPRRLHPRRLDRTKHTTMARPEYDGADSSAEIRRPSSLPSFRASSASPRPSLTREMSVAHPRRCGPILTTASAIGPSELHVGHGSTWCTRRSRPHRIHHISRPARFAPRG